MLRHVPTLHIVAQDGAGAKPIVNVTGQTLYNNIDGGASQNKDFVVQGIDWRGEWDSSNSTGAAIPCFQALENAPQQALFDQNEFDGFANSIVIGNIGGTGARINFIANDNISTNWRNYAVYGSVGNLAFTGNRFTSSVNALSGDGADGVQGGAIRLQAPSQAIVQSNDLFANAGWFVNIPGYYTCQPAIRCMSGVSRGAIYNMQANALEGGFNCFAFEAGPPRSGEPINAIVEKNLMVGNHMTRKIGNIQYGGVTIRNNICIMPNVERIQRLFNPNRFFDLLNDPAGSVENMSSPIKIYSNTLVNLVSAQTGFGTAEAIPVVDGATNSFSAIEEANNLVHQPNLSTPSAPDAPLIAETLWSPRYAGYVDPDTPRITATITPASTPALYRPGPGSDALGDAINGPVAFDDFFGNPRPQYPSRGALEMS